MVENELNWKCHLLEILTAVCLCSVTLEHSVIPTHKWKVSCDGSLHCWVPLLQVLQGDVILVDEGAGVSWAATGLLRLL